MIQLHSVQLLGIFRLLGVDKRDKNKKNLNTTTAKTTAPATTRGTRGTGARVYGEAQSRLLGDDYHNHLVEILTGQGKSFVMCALALTMALMDFEV